MNPMARVASIGFSMLILGTLSAVAVEAPKVSLQKLEALPIEVPAPYDTSADANAAVDAAIAKAKAANKLVLIDLGGNWCADCVILTNVMRLPEVAPFVAAHYEVVLVDVGRFNKNLQIPARFGITERLRGAPALLIVDPNSKLVDAGHIIDLDTARNMQPQTIVDWLAGWIS